VASRGQKIYTCHVLLDVAEDMALVHDLWFSMQLTISVIQKKATKVPTLVAFFCRTRDKCKVITTSAGNKRLDIQGAGMDLKLVSDLCYLDSYTSYNGSCEKMLKCTLGKQQQFWENEKDLEEQQNKLKSKDATVRVNNFIDRSLQC